MNEKGGGGWCLVVADHWECLCRAFGEHWRCGCTWRNGTEERCHFGKEECMGAVASN